jgi:hypothetical protein
MRQTQQIELYNLFRESNIQQEKAEQIVKILADDSQTAEDLKKIFLTKDDKIDIITRIDSQAKWLAGFFLAIISIAVAVIKLL